MPLKIIESTIREIISPDVEMVTTINRHVGRHLKSARTTIEYLVNLRGEAVWRRAVSYTSSRTRQTRFRIAAQQEQIAYRLIEQGA